MEIRIEAVEAVGPQGFPTWFYKIQGGTVMWKAEEVMAWLQRTHGYTETQARRRLMDATDHG